MNERPQVLIVDDEKNVLFLIKSALQSLEMEIDTAEDGIGALEMIRSTHYDLILLDLRLPGMDGLSVLKEIRSKNVLLDVIIITAHGTVEVAVEAMKLGALDFMSKPFTPDEIREKVIHVLDRKHLSLEERQDYDSCLELAKMHVKQRNYSRAKEFVLQAIQTVPKRPAAYNYLGAILEVLGELPDAIDAYRMALSLDPNMQAAKKNIERLALKGNSGQIFLDITHE